MPTAPRSPSAAAPSALLLGATGLVGGHLLPLLAADGRWAHVVTLGRRPMPRAGPRHAHHVIDFERLAERPELFTCDDVFCCLGTTIKQAGSEEAFARVDRDYPLEAARLARGQGATQYLLVSSLGASPRSPFFYTRVKGELEEALEDVGFESLSIFRPSQLAGERAEERPGERWALAALRVARPALVGPLRRLRPTPAEAVARAMAAVAAERPAGVRVFEAEEIVKRARTP
jgi:uncharacterized protein YbjT (DUF2867 family)